MLFRSVVDALRARVVLSSQPADDRPVALGALCFQVRKERIDHARTTVFGRHEQIVQKPDLAAAQRHVQAAADALPEDPDVAQLAATIQ